MAKKLFDFIESEDPRDLARFCREVARVREEDVSDFNNLPNIFMQGRKVGKIPASSADTIDNRIGDFNYDADYLYICVNDSGSAAWRRVAIGGF